MKDAKTSKHSAPLTKKQLLIRAALILLLVLVLAAGGLAWLFRQDITGGRADGQTVTVTVEQGVAYCYLLLGDPTTNNPYG